MNIVSGTIDIKKLDDSEHLVFGYAMLGVNKSGQLITDLQGDQIEPEDLEQAQYDFVLESRRGGEMHGGRANMELVESWAITPEKLEKMGIPDGILPKAAAWVGFKLNDNATYERIKRGDRLMFSIEGEARRVD